MLVEREAGVPAVFSSEKQVQDPGSSILVLPKLKTTNLMVEQYMNLLSQILEATSLKPEGKISLGKEGG